MGHLKPNDQSNMLEEECCCLMLNAMNHPVKVMSQNSVDDVVGLN